MIRKVSEKQRKRNIEKAKNTEQLHKLFKEIWDSSEDEAGNCYCFESGRVLPGYIYRSNTCCYHHLLPKSKYPQYEMDKENIVILDPDIHTQVEVNIEKCPKVKRLLDELKERYDKCIEKGELE